MSDTNPPKPPEQPPPEPAPPPAPAPAPGTPSTWPGATQTGPAPWAAPPSPWAQPPGTYAPYQPTRTNGLALTSMILGLVALVFWPLAFFLGLGAVITGHIARGQLRRAKERGAPEQGAGMALAGIILGYVWIGLSILGAIALVLILTLAVPATTQVSVRHDARDFGNDTITTAAAENVSPRDPDVVREVYRQRYLLDHNSSNKRAQLPDGKPLSFVTAATLRANGYRIEFSEDTIGTKYACLTLPATTFDAPEVHDGRC